MTKYPRRDGVKMGIGAWVTMAGGGHAPVDAAPTPVSGRVRLNFNRDYQFALGDHPGAQHMGYDTTAWEDVHLPHSFSLPYWGEPQVYVGFGWYRKPFRVPTQWRTKHIFLEFEAAFQDAEVFVNGRRAGRHRGGYTLIPPHRSPSAMGRRRLNFGPITRDGYACGPPRPASRRRPSSHWRPAGPRRGR